MKPVLYVVIPCYNEEKVLPITAPMFLHELNKLVDMDLIDQNSKIMFVNDGSRDNTWEIIKKKCKENTSFKGVCLSNNRGHQNALLAGLMESKDKCDITISIDCDGQDDIAAMEQMVREYIDGCEVVYGVRDNRQTDSFFKRFSAETFYKFMRLMGADVVFNHSDYRLISSRVLKEFENFKETNLFLRGLIPLVGFKSTSVYYKRNKRLGGKSHYPFKKMVSLALNGITSLSIKPLQLISALGIIISLISFIGVIWAVISAFLGQTVAGWASTVSIVCFVGGIQLICLGVIGEYIGKIYIEVKNRPRYIISEKTED